MVKLYPILRVEICLYSNSLKNMILFYLYMSPLVIMLNIWSENLIVCSDLTVGK